MEQLRGISPILYECQINYKVSYMIRNSTVQDMKVSFKLKICAVLYMYNVTCIRRTSAITVVIISLQIDIEACI